MISSNTGRSVCIICWLAAVSVLLTAGCATKSQRLYRRAEAFFAQGQYELAAREYSRIVQEIPRDPLADDAWYKLAYLYREELDNPTAALQLYRRLADEYENSNYVDESLLWMVYLQRRHLRDPDMAAATCREVDRRFPDDNDLRGRVHLEAAGAYLDDGQLEQARKRYRQISEQFSDCSSIAAQALLMLANITRKSAEDPQESLKQYEQVISRYPDTQAAVTARQAAGWVYYGEKTEQEQVRLAQQRKQARVLTSVPPIEQYPGRPVMELLAAIRSLLHYAGAQASMDELIVISGLPFTFTFALDGPKLVQAFYRNPAAAIVDQMGFGYNLWTSAGGANVLNTATGCLTNDRPLLVAYGSPQAQWCLITGHRPAEKEIYLLKPAAREATRLSSEKFLQVWQKTEVPSLWPQGSVSGLQFALAGRQRQADLLAALKAAVLQASLAWDQPELMRQPAGAAACRAFVKTLKQAAADQTPGQRAKIKSWARQAIPLIVSSRRTAARLFAQPLPDLSEREKAIFAEASGRYDEIATQWDSLAELLAEADSEAEGPGDESGAGDMQQWRRAVTLAEEVTNRETESLHWLASSLAE